MIQEAYCSFEVAKLMKEKGFNERSAASYDSKGQLQEGYGYWNKTPIWCAAPTHQMAMAWLREVHNILLFVLPTQENGKLLYLVEVWTWNKEKGIYESIYASIPRKKPEQAIEPALKYCLENLI